VRCHIGRGRERESARGRAGAPLRRSWREGEIFWRDGERGREFGRARVRGRPPAPPAQHPVGLAVLLPVPRAEGEEEEGGRRHHRAEGRPPPPSP
jgi:hypothetical protein